MEENARKRWGKAIALHLLDRLVAHHGQRLSKLQRYLRLAKAYNNTLWERHLLNLIDDAFRNCGRWSNERRRVKAFDVAQEEG
jgi:hypothetical protein